MPCRAVPCRAVVCVLHASLKVGLFEVPVLFQDIVIDGYKIPGGYTVAYLTRAANMDPKVFQDGEKFIPERWDTWYVLCFAAPYRAVPCQQQQQQQQQQQDYNYQ